MCRFIAELANLPLRNDQPFVGKSAFAHKGGVHVSAVLKDSATYEHIPPETVGNRQRVLVSDLSGRGNIMYKLKQHGLAGPPGRRRAPRTAGAHQADGVRGLRTGGGRRHLRAAGARGAASGDCISSTWTATKWPRAPAAPAPSHTTATVTLRAQDGVHSATATGHGPFHALHLCLRKCLAKLYPQIADVRLTDYKVRVLDSHKGTAAKVRVLIEWSRPPQELVDGGRFGQRDRSELESAGGRHPPGADAADRAGRLGREAPSKTTAGACRGDTAIRVKVSRNPG